MWIPKIVQVSHEYLRQESVSPLLSGTDLRGIQRLYAFSTSLAGPVEARVRRPGIGETAASRSIDGPVYLDVLLSYVKSFSWGLLSTKCFPLCPSCTSPFWTCVASCGACCPLILPQPALLLGHHGLQCLLPHPLLISVMSPPTLWTVQCYAVLGLHQDICPPIPPGPPSSICCRDRREGG